MGDGVNEVSSCLFVIQIAIHKTQRVVSPSLSATCTLRYVIVPRVMLPRVMLPRVILLRVSYGHLSSRVMVPPRVCLLA